MKIKFPSIVDSVAENGWVRLFSYVLCDIYLLINFNIYYFLVDTKTK